jgi:hypothetical protein
VACPVNKVKLVTATIDEIRQKDEELASTANFLTDPERTAALLWTRIREVECVSVPRRRNFRDLTVTIRFPGCTRS